MHFFIQARTGSSRLPNKVLLPFYKNETILDIIIDKLHENFIDIPIILCTSTNEKDTKIEQFCKQKNIKCFRGDENNVLQRFADAATIFNAKTIIRICADNPFLDVEFLKELIQFYEQNPNNDYWSFKNSFNTPVIKTHFGFFAEIVTTKALKKVLNKTDDKLYLEHVTNYIYSNSEFNIKLKQLPSYLKNRTDLRFTIDDAEDFSLMKELYSCYIENNCNLEQTIRFVDDNEMYLNRMIQNIKKYSK